MTRSTLGFYSQRYVFYPCARRALTAGYITARAKSPALSDDPARSLANGARGLSSASQMTETVTPMRWKKRLGLGVCSRFWYGGCLAHEARIRGALRIVV